jgi:TolB protein
MRWCTLLCLLVVGVAAPAGDFAPAPVCVSKIDGDFIQQLSWSPDGKKFLFTRIHKGKVGLWTMNVDGSELKALLPKETMPHFDGHWSADSKRIIFIYDKLDGKLRIDVINADGTEHKNLLPHKAFDESPRWSPDGKQVVRGRFSNVLRLILFHPLSDIRQRNATADRWARS